MNMHWSRIDVSRSDVTLLNSDRPIDKPLGLNYRLAYIAFPIGPNFSPRTRNVFLGLV